MKEYAPTQQQLDERLGKGWEKSLHRDEVRDLLAMSPIQAHYCIKTSDALVRRAMRMVAIDRVKREWNV